MKSKFDYMKWLPANSKSKLKTIFRPYYITIEDIHGTYFHLGPSNLRKILVEKVFVTIILTCLKSLIIT